MCSIAMESIYVSLREISLYFIKGDIRLVSDVWYPSMHVVKPGYLLEDGVRGQHWLYAICMVLT